MPKAKTPRPSAKTARQPRGERKADEILTVSIDILVEEGYAALTLRRVAERAGVALSHVQYYFPSRQELLRAMFARNVAEYEKRMLRKATDAGIHGRAGLIFLVDYTLAFYRSEKACRSFWELWALAAHDRGAAEVLDGYLDLFCKLVAGLILEAKSNLSQQVANRRAAIIVSLLEGVSLIRGAGKPRRPEHRGIEDELREKVIAIALGD